MGTPHKYWRIFVEQNQGSWNTTCAEIKFQTTPGGTNVATEYSRLFTSSNRDGATSHSYLIDTNPSSFWASGSAPIPGPVCWIGYQFPNPVDIQAVSWSSRPNVRTEECPKAFMVQASDDGDWWFDVWVVRNIPFWWGSETRQFIRDADLDLNILRAHRYWQLYVHISQCGPGSDIGKNVGLAEWLLFEGGTNGANILGNKALTASSFWEQDKDVRVDTQDPVTGVWTSEWVKVHIAEVPAHANDGNYDTLWSAAVGQPQWLKVDLLTPKNIANTRIWTRNDEYWNQVPSLFDLRYSDDAINYYSARTTSYWGWTGPKQFHDFEVAPLPPPPPAPTVSITFDGYDARDIVQIDANTWDCYTPAHVEGGVDVSLTIDGVTLTQILGYTFYEPGINSVSPASGHIDGGNTAHILGDGFVDGSVVYFGSTPATVTVLAETDIIVTVPAGAAGTVTVSVYPPGSGQPLTLADAYTYEAASIISIAPTVLPTYGGTLTVFGEWLKVGARVLVDGYPVPQTTRVSATELRATIQSGLTVGFHDISVWNSSTETTNVLTDALEIRGNYIPPDDPGGSGAKGTIIFIVT